MSLDFPAFELTEEHQELRAVVRALADPVPPASRAPAPARPLRSWRADLAQP